MRKRGRPPKHGGYSIIHRDALLKDHPHIRCYLQECREGLIRDVAGTEEALTEQQRIMIDRLISRLSICRLIELYVERKGVFTGSGELVSCLGTNYLAFSNSIDRALTVLGIEKRAGENALSPLEYMRQYDEDKQKMERQKFPAQSIGQGRED
jgi:hypothetical protein